jgi:hypothetical protein
LNGSRDAWGPPVGERSTQPPTARVAHLAAVTARPFAGRRPRSECVERSIHAVVERPSSERTPAWTTPPTGIARACLQGATNAMQAGHPFNHLLLDAAYRNRGDPPSNVRTHASHIPRLCSRAQKLNLGGRADRTHITHRTKDQTKLPIKNAHTLLSNSAPPARSILHAITSCDPSGSLLSLLANHHR